MDDQVPAPNIVAQSQTPPQYGPVKEPEVTAAPPSASSSFFSSLPKIPIRIVGIIAVFAVVIVGSILFTQKKQSKVAVAPTPTPTAAPTPTPIQTLAPFATTSAFTTFSTEVDSLPTTIQGAVIQDQTTTPPVLDLSLGF